MPVIDIQMFSEQKEGTESFVGLWLKQPGDAVNANEPIVEISTDKVSMEIPAPASGVLREIVKAANQPVAPGEVLGRIEVGASPQTAAPLPSATREQRPPHSSNAAEEGLSPAVRRMIREHDLDPRLIPGSGRGGRITYDDVLEFVANQKSASKIPSRMIPHTAMRRSIANHMLRSVQSVPHVTAVFEADLSRVLADRDSYKNHYSGQVPSITAYLIGAAVQAIRAVPEVNSRWHDDVLEIFDDSNIGIGTAIEGGGLIVPVIHGAQNLKLLEIAARLRELKQKARTGSLKPEEVQGGTFTISNHGVTGTLLAAPIIIPLGQTSILGAGRLEKRVIVVDDNGTDVIRAKPMMYVTLTVDHRALDAQQTNAFMTAFVHALETWS